VRQSYFRFLCIYARWFAVVLALVSVLFVILITIDLVTDKHDMANPVSGLFFCAVLLVASLGIWKFATAALSHIDRMP
jgi:hypothetical protein